MISESRRSATMLWLGPALALSCGLLPYLVFDWPSEAAITTAIIVLCALWWATEVIPIPVTSLLPLALFPLFGVLTAKQVAASYGDKFILLLMGGFLLSTAMEHSGAHRRIALFMVNLFGNGSHRRVVLGFMAASGLLSMWISNTATTLMLLPIALAVLQGSDSKHLQTVLLLGICYAASIGGIATPIGTPPNLVFMQVYSQTTGEEFSFSQWLSWGLPVVLVFLPIAGFYLTRKLRSGEQLQIPEAGPWTPIQKRVLAVFATTALLWVTRAEPYGGWSELLGFRQANDASVALLAVLSMFIISDGKGGRLLTWERANKIPWGILLLFSSGLCIAKAFGESGLAAMLAANLTGIVTLPLLLTIAIICLMVTFLTELTSNTATTALLMPVLATVGLSVGIDPVILMIPAAISASCAFMLPVATAPNAIIFGSQRVAIKSMIKHGLALNLLGALLVASLCFVRYTFLDLS